MNGDAYSLNMDAKSLPKGKKTMGTLKTPRKTPNTQGSLFGPGLSSNLEPGPSAILKTNLKIYKNLEFQTLPPNFGALVPF